MIKNHREFLKGLIVGVLFLGLGTVVQAAWTEPTANPTSGNIPAPINVSDSTQYKGGNLVVNNNGIGEYGLIVPNGGVASDRFCDEAGNNCFTAAEIAVLLAQ